MQATYFDLDKFKVSGDKTSVFVVGRRVKVDCNTDGIVYATILSSSYSSPDTTVTINKSTLTVNLQTVLYGIVEPGDNGSLPKHNHNSDEGSGGQIIHYGTGDPPAATGLADGTLFFKYID